MKTVTRSGFCLLLNNLRCSCWTDPQKRLGLRLQPPAAFPPPKHASVYIELLLQSSCFNGFFLSCSKCCYSFFNGFHSSVSRPVLVCRPQSCLPFGGDNWQQMVLQGAASEDPAAPPNNPHSLGDGCYATLGDVTSEECEKGGGACCGTRAVAVAKTRHDPDPVQVFGDRDGCSAL